MGFFTSSKSGTSSQSQAPSSSQQGVNSRPAPPPPPPAGNKRAATIPRKTKNGPPRPLSDLTPDALYLTLFVIGTDDESRFHWGLYLHYDEDGGGKKYHINTISNRASSWEAMHGVTKGGI